MTDRLPCSVQVRYGPNAPRQCFNRAKGQAADGRWMCGRHLGLSKEKEERGVTTGYSGEQAVAVVDAERRVIDAAIKETKAEGETGGMRYTAMAERQEAVAALLLLRGQSGAVKGEDE